MKNDPEYAENQSKVESRFVRRYEAYKQSNEGEDKGVLEFFKENNIEVFNYDEKNALTDFDGEFNRLMEYLNKDGPINCHERFCEDEEEFDDVEDENETQNKDQEKNSQINEEEPNKEGNLDVIQEKDSKNPSKKPSKRPSKIVEPKENPPVPVQENNPPPANDSDAKKQSSNNLQEELKINEEEEKKKEAQRQIEAKLLELQEREQKLLEKKSEVLRRYLSENVIPLLAKGVLNVCQNTPDDPVESLANFLLDNSFNPPEKGANENIEQINPEGNIEVNPVESNIDIKLDDKSQQSKAKQSEGNENSISDKLNKNISINEDGNKNSMEANDSEVNILKD